LQITQPMRAERRIGASRLPTRIVRRIRSKLEKLAVLVTFQVSSLAKGVHAQF
jgi:hypothetical protein